MTLSDRRQIRLAKPRQSPDNLFRSRLKAEYTVPSVICLRAQLLSERSEGKLSEQSAAAWGEQTEMTRLRWCPGYRYRGGHAAPVEAFGTDYNPDDPYGPTVRCLQCRRFYVMTDNE